jgi:hypothetical protein
MGALVEPLSESSIDPTTGASVTGAPVEPVELAPEDQATGASVSAASSSADTVYRVK